MGRHGWNSGARRWRPIALLGVAVAAFALILTLSGLPDGQGSPRGTSTDGGQAHDTPAEPSGTPRAELGWGFTHTRHSADEGERPAVDRATKLLAARPLPQVQHLMGWGADNPEPSPGRYDFEAMDRRIDFVRATKGTPVVTLCCAPDWMKGGKAGADHTDWSRASLETAPDPDHFDDFAQLAATVAERYPDVRHFVVWNEFKGFWNSAEERWDHEGYTELYNKVHRALKNVDEDILVGGPYLVMDSVEPRRRDNASTRLKGRWGSADQRVLDAFTYWNEHKAGADFVVVDGSSYTVDDELIPDAVEATAKFTAVGRWIREHTGDLPLWWAEYYVEPGDADDDRDGWSERRRLATHAAGLIAMARGGATTAFYWNPQNRGAACAGCLWRATDLADGGTPLPMLDLLTRFQREFPPGTRYERADVAATADGPPQVRVLADDKATLVVNVLDRAVTVKVDGRSLDLPAYGVKWLRR